MRHCFQSLFNCQFISLHSQVVSLFYILFSFDEWILTKGFQCSQLLLNSKWTKKLWFVRIVYSYLANIMRLQVIWLCLLTKAYECCNLCFPWIPWQLAQICYIKGSCVYVCSAKCRKLQNKHSQSWYYVDLFCSR